MKRAFALLLSLFLFAGLLTGCQSQDEGESGGAGKKSVTLKAVTQFGGDDANTTLFNTIIQEWTQKTGHKITNQSAKADNTWKSSVIADFNTGSEPDVLFFYNGAVMTDIQDKIVDVEEIRKEYPDYAKNIRDSVMMAENNLNKDGKPMCVPIKGYAEGIFCNKNVFEEAGAALPTDWASLMDAIAKIKAKGKIPLSVSLGGEPHYYFDHSILAVGGAEAMNVNPRSESEIPDSWKQGLSLIKVLYDAGAFPKDTASIDGDGARAYFLGGDAAMYLDGSWFSVPADGTKDAKVTQKDVEVIPFPSYTTSKNEKGTILSGFSSGWYITRKCWDNKDKRQAAIDFINYNITDEAIDRYVEASGGFTASDTANINESKQTPQQKQFTKLLKEAPSTPMVAQDNLEKAAFEVFLRNAMAIAKGDKSPDAVLKEMVSLNKK